MERDVITQLKSKTADVFVKLGFIPTYIGLEKTYEYKGVYHKLTFLSGLGGMDFFVIECASSYDDACKNVYEDCDLLPLSWGEKELLIQFENILIEYYMN